MLLQPSACFYLHTVPRYLQQTLVCLRWNAKENIRDPFFSGKIFFFHSVTRPGAGNSISLIDLRCCFFYFEHPCLPFLKREIGVEMRRNEVVVVVAVAAGVKPRHPPSANPPRRPEIWTLRSRRHSQIFSLFSAVAFPPHDEVNLSHNNSQSVSHLNPHLLQPLSPVPPQPLVMWARTSAQE